MSIDTLWAEATALFETFGWYSILLVVATTLVMIPVNQLFKVIMKKECLSRLRKTVSTLFVYVVAVGVIALFTWTVAKQPITFAYLIGASIPCGFLAQGLWVIIKLAKDYGWTFIKWLLAKIFTKTASNVEFKKTLANLGINKKVVEVIASEIKDIKVENMEQYLKQEGTLTAKIKAELNGFTAVENLENAVKLCLDKVKSSIKQEKKADKVDESKKV